MKAVRTAYRLSFAMATLCGALAVTMGARGEVPPGGGSILESHGVGDAFFAPFHEKIRASREQWRQKAESAKPALRHRVVQPKRIVKFAAGDSAFQGWAVHDAGAVADFMNRPLSQGEEFILDFGEHIVGRFELGLVDFGSAVDAPVRLALSFAEMPCELAEDQEAAKPSLSRSWFQSEVFTFDDVPSVNRLPRRYAFRYVRMKVAGCSGGGRFGLGRIAVETETSADEASIKAWTPPSDKAAKIDATACRTLRDCMQTVFEDGPKRDRRLWLGDLRLEALADYETYRNFEIVKRSLYVLAGTCAESGLVNSDAYERPVLRSGACRILDYTAIYAATVLEYLEASGDEETARDLWPLCAMQTKFVLSCVCPDGVFRDNGKWWCFIDWQGPLNRQTAEQGAIIFGLKKTWKLARRLGRTEDVKFIPEVVAKMEDGARKVLWNEAKGCFACEKDAQVSWMGQAWLVLAGVPDASSARRCLKTAMDDASAVRPVTPYANHYFIEALYAAGMRNEGDARLLSYFGGMVDLGADTFWEVFVPEDHRAGPYSTHLMNSYCHAWSCAPAYFLRNAKYKALSGARR